MTNKETVNRNIGLALDFLKQLNDKPTLLNKISDNTIIEFVEKDFPKKETEVSRKEHKKYVIVKNEFEVI